MMEARKKEEAKMAKLTVGKFTLENGTLTGPTEYMAEQGNALLEKIYAGQSAVFNAGCRYSPNIETAVLVALQTDYAGWRGMKQFDRFHKGGK